MTIPPTSPFIPTLKDLAYFPRNGVAKERKNSLSEKVSFFILKNAIFINIKDARDFEETCSIIKDPDGIRSTQRLLELIQKKAITVTGPFLSSAKKPTEIFLSAFLFASHPKDTLDVLNPKETDLLDAALKLIDSYDKVRNVIEETDLTELGPQSAHSAFLDFSQDYQSYVGKFCERQREHKLRLTTGIIETYMKMELKKEQITKSNPSKNQRGFYSLIEKSQKNLLHKLHSFSEPESLDLFYKKLEELSLVRANLNLDLLCDESMKDYYEMALNPNFEFKLSINSSETLQIYRDISLATAAKPICFPIICGAFLNVRRRLICLVSNNVALVDSIRETMNAANLLPRLRQLNEPLIFKESFLYLAHLVSNLENFAQQEETAQWIESVLDQVEEEKDLFSLLPDIFRVLHNKIDQIVVIKKNFHYEKNKPFYLNACTSLARKHFETQVNLYEIQLDKTRGWLHHMLQEGNSAGLTKEMIFSNKSSSHVLSMGLIAQMLSPVKLLKKDCPETLLMERTRLNSLKSSFNAMKRIAVCLETYRYFIKEKGGKTLPLEYVKRIISKFLKVPRFRNSSDCLNEKSPNLATSAEEAFRTFKAIMIKALDPQHRIHKVVNKMFHYGLKHYLYKGYLPEAVSAHPVYRIFPEFETCAKKLRNLAIFNLSVHKDIYDRFILEQRSAHPYELLCKPTPLSHETCPSLFHGEMENINEIRTKILKLSQIITSLTFIRMKVWFSHLFINPDDDKESHKSHFSPTQLADLIERFEVRKLFSDASIAAKDIYKVMKKIFQNVIDERQIALAPHEIKHMNALLRGVSRQKNRELRAFQDEIVLFIKNSISGRSKSNSLIENTLKLNFHKELIALSDEFEKIIRKSLNEKSDFEIEAPLELSSFTFMNKLSCKNSLTGRLA